MKQRLLVLLFTLIFSNTALAQEGASCTTSQAQRHAKAAQRYTIDSMYSLLSECGLGDLLNFGIGNLGDLINLGEGCDKPLETIAKVPIDEGERGIQRGYNDGMKRPVNSEITQVRKTVKSGDWYKDDDWYTDDI